jgi:hypothetical protein
LLQNRDQDPQPAEDGERKRTLVEHIAADGANGDDSGAD